MAYKIVITEQAKEDTQAAYDYYDDLTDHPQHYGYIDHQGIIRDVKIDRFPYVIVFEIIEERVIVYAILNTYRHPKRKLKP